MAESETKLERSKMSETPPTTTDKKSNAEIQRKYRLRLAASRNAAQNEAAKKLDAARKRNYRLLAATILANTPPKNADPKSNAQRQREYRRRLASSRTSAEVDAAKKLDTMRKRNYRLRKAANLTRNSGFATSATAISKNFQTDTQQQLKSLQPLAAEPAYITVQPVSSDSDTNAAGGVAIYPKLSSPSMANVIRVELSDPSQVINNTESKMALQSNMQLDSNLSPEHLSNISVKQEVLSEVNEDIHVKHELDYNEDHAMFENPFENIQVEVKHEYVPPPNDDKQMSDQINENYEITIEKYKEGGENNSTGHSFITEVEKSKHKVGEETISNIYDDNIEIKQEDNLADSAHDYSNFDDTQSMDSDEAKALNNVEACLQDEIKIKTESELFEENENHDLDKVNIKDEIELTVTETHLISNKVINTTSTVTNPQDGIIKSQTTKTLVMEILPMIRPGEVGDVSNPEEILSTPYTNNEYDLMDYDDTFQLNSITGDVMTLEQEAYGLLEAKGKIERLDRPYVCTKCPKAYKSASSFRRHKSVHDSIEKRAMGILKGQKTRMANIKKKMKEEDKKYTAKVKKPEKPVKVETVVVTPVVDNVKKEGYECTCGNVFRRRSRMETCLRSHNMSTDPNSYFPCVTCSKHFKDKEELALHRKRLHRKRFPCKFCPTDYNTRKELFKHLQIHQKVQVMEYKVLSEIAKGKQKLKCFMCAKTCTELSELKSHVMDDHKEPYICPHCNGTFSKIIDFGNHTKTDHPEVEGQSVLDVLEAFSKLVKAWKCEECEVQFHEADKLALHQIEKHSPDLKIEPQFQCIDCRRVFITQKGLTSHRRVHHSTESAEISETVDKGVMCVECRKVCKDMNALTSHMRLHSTERKYPCKFCDFRFATPEKKKAHAELHTGDMKYVCFICEYQCSSENRLKQHKMSAKHLSMKDFLTTGKQSIDKEQSTSKKSKTEKTEQKEEWVVVKEKGTEEDSGDDAANAAAATCEICGKTFKTESKMLKHQKIHPFIEIPNDDKPTRIFFK